MDGWLARCGREGRGKSERTTEVQLGTLNRLGLWKGGVVGGKGLVVVGLLIWD
jgi:hypothetical protein